MADDGRVILKSVDHELSQLIRVLNSFAAVVALKHVQKRLSAYKFELKMEAFLELEMLTTVVVVTYVRLQQGGSGSSRDSIPEQLRSIHDRVVGLRNKRFAHNDEHDTVSNALEVWFEDNRFELKFGLSLGYDIGGAKEWPDLVSAVETLYLERIEKLLARMKQKTSHEWALQSGPAPEE
ncbi:MULTISPECIES: hypothetical protein [Bradyrhizobium]|uniref:Uncharacterized protein n=1 Tax=Bradyrhizobium arachidis TaxID=858423 RepID=A0AAE7NNG7_9BRAD|nr:MULTISPECIES: hypothetical protein [Bradyrhizobium]QOZ66603.1 hypothetical protein WN72_09635 [Bradyrhizobium arachidis]SFV17343.1 hypothetical protein SAMN05192541_12834 [Bradyrhizobium arachidis]